MSVPNQMKDISIYFSSINIGDQVYEETQLGSKIIEIDESMENVEKGSLALVFIDEYRNSKIESHQDSFSYILDKIYQLESGAWNKNIYNLGKSSSGIL